VVVAEARHDRAQIGELAAAGPRPLGHHRVEAGAGPAQEEAAAARPDREPEVAGDDAPLLEAAGGPSRIAEEAEVAAGIAPTPGHERTDRHRALLAKGRDPVDDLVERAVSAHRHHQRHAGAGGFSGQRCRVAGPAGLRGVEDERDA